jgi:16S rRNA (adenine1518-N6/adenine1519-N6)-dimethyltransferase
VTALTATALRVLLDEHGVGPSRALGQHFLADPNTARRIVRLAGVTTGERVLEIGPGAGSLTVELVASGARVTALELDRHLVPVLDDVLERRGIADRVRVECGDALTTDLAALLAGEPHAMVSNLPYNVAVPIVMRVLESVPLVPRLVVMVQREVADRLVAAPGGKEYGAVSVRVAYHAAARRVGVVPASVFLPPPRVDSALVEIVRHLVPPVVVASPDLLFALVRAGFAQRRKMLRRALRTELGDSTEPALAAAGIAPTARAESLDLETWAALARATDEVRS